MVASEIRRKEQKPGDSLNLCQAEWLIL